MPALVHWPSRSRTTWACGMFRSQGYSGRLPDRAALTCQKCHYIAALVHSAARHATGTLLCYSQCAHPRCTENLDLITCRSCLYVMRKRLGLLSHKGPRPKVHAPGVSTAHTLCGRSQRVARSRLRTALLAAEVTCVQCQTALQVTHYGPHPCMAQIPPRYFAAPGDTPTCPACLAHPVYRAQQAAQRRAAQQCRQGRVALPRPVGEYRHYGAEGLPALCGVTADDCPGFARSLDWDTIDCPHCVCLREGDHHVVDYLRTLDSRGLGRGLAVRGVRP